MTAPAAAMPLDRGRPASSASTAGASRRACGTAYRARAAHAVRSGAV
ncbi:hypothetical protein AB0D11_38765 [Streptomyces monashensis]